MVVNSSQARERDEKAILMVIPCLNEEQYVEKLVHDFVASNQDLSMSIVIVDGGSTDSTPEIARRLAEQYTNVHFLKNPKRLQSAAINLAVSLYGHEATYLIRVDAHCDYPANYCKDLIAEAELTKAASVVVAMKTVGKKGFQQVVAAAQNSKLGNGGSAHRSANHRGKWVDHGHHALMRLDAFRHVGGYDETFSHNEDAELDTRLAKAGFKIWLGEETIITYYPRSSPFALFRQYIQYGYGRARNMIKHGNVPKIRQLIPAAVVPAIIALASPLLLFASPLVIVATLPILAWAILCLGYGVILGIRTRNANAVFVGPAAMIMHLGWSLGFWRGIFEKMLGFEC